MHHELATKSKVEFEALAEDALLVKGIVGGEKEKDRLIKALWGLKGINKVTDHLKIGTLSRLIY